VLGHKVGVQPFRLVDSFLVGGFDLRTLGYIASQMVEQKLTPASKKSPLWNKSNTAAVSAEPGLWALEPHIGKNGVGAKWEELLVVTDSDAYWLDDDLPHVQGWKKKSA
jgi:hypothetical protein